jgi:hypothetical protein
LLFLESDNPDKDISLYINSPGGSVYAGMAVYDTMQFIKPDVSTLCTGFAASMGSFLLAAGAIGKRYALPNARLMIHQPHGGSQGVAADIEIQAREVLYQRHRLNTILDRKGFGPRQLHVGPPGRGIRPDRPRAGDARRRLRTLTTGRPAAGVAAQPVRQAPSRRRRYELIRIPMVEVNNLASQPGSGHLALEVG